MDILNIAVWIFVGSLTFAFVLYVLDMIVEALTGKSLTNRLSRQEEFTFQWEDDLHEIRRMLEEYSKKETPKPTSPYKELTDTKLRQLAKEADEKMKRMR